MEPSARCGDADGDDHEALGAIYNVVQRTPGR